MIIFAHRSVIGKYIFVAEDNVVTRQRPELYFHVAVNKRKMP